MKTILFASFVLASLAAFAGAAQSQQIQLSAGVVCQPATAADAARLDFSNGSAANVFAAPGSADQVASVVCALQPVPPGYVMVRATVWFFDPARRWPRAYCNFFNLAPGVAPRSVPILGLSTNLSLASAALVVDPFAFVPHAVNCSIRPGQRIYAIETTLELLQ